MGNQLQFQYLLTVSSDINFALIYHRSKGEVWFLILPRRGSRLGNLDYREGASARPPGFEAGPRQRRWFCVYRRAGLQEVVSRNRCDIHTLRFPAHYSPFLIYPLSL